MKSKVKWLLTDDKNNENKSCLEKSKMGLNRYILHLRFDSKPTWPFLSDQDFLSFEPVTF